MTFNHVPVLLDEVIVSLNLGEGKIVIDGTLGGCGHTDKILSKIGVTGRLLGIDRDIDAVTHGKAKYISDKRITIVKGNFKGINEIAVSNGFDEVDAIVLDLGLSSHQIDDPERGFSFDQDVELDMRMDKNSPVTARELLAEITEQRLGSILKEYSDERYFKIIAREIKREVSSNMLIRSCHLRDIVTRVYRRFGNKNVLDGISRVFQAIRMEVNEEMQNLSAFLNSFPVLLKKGGRIAVIAFHSTEDRMVKERFKELALTCTCPRDFPICRCETKAKIRIVERIKPSEAEVFNNPRARSAILRVAEAL